MNITLHSLTLRNFKGVRDFTLTLNGNSCRIDGENGTGKSTIMDAFLWLLFNKDSQGKADFQIKTVDANGNEIHNLEHTVEAVLSVDGDLMTLKKTLQEKWTKKRGELHPEFSGHTTDYSVDGVPVKEKDWKEKIASLIPEETFRLLTNPAHFNSLKWQDRRSLLLQVCGDVSDADVIAANSDLKALSAILGSKRTVEEHKQVIKSRQKAINDQLKDIPGRIDEQQRNIAAVADFDRDLILAHIDVLDQQIQDRKATGSGGDVALRQERSNLMLRYQELTGKRKLELQTRQGNYQSGLTLLRTDVQANSVAYARHLKEQGLIQDRIATLNKRLDAMRAEYKTLAAKDNAVKDICPACGQSLPESQVQAAIAKANEAKALALEANKREGMAVKKSLLDAQAELVSCVENTDKAQADTEKLQAQLAVLQNNPPPQAHSLDAEIEQINASIADLTAKIQNATPADTMDTSAQEAEVKAEREKIASLDAAEKSKTRIEELANQQKELAKEFEKLSGELYICDKFMVRKVEMLDNAINSKFAMARFQMFETQINGGLAECCTTLVNGVPYGRGLNRGNELNVGLDIINTLSQHYGMTCPVFVDNAEAVTQLFPIDSQMIKLYVAEGVKPFSVKIEA